MSEGIQYVVDAIEQSGRIFKVRRGELNTRCGFCGDSSKSSQSMHFYINLEAPHKCFCQRCGYRSGSINSDVLDALGATEQSASVYVRTVMKSERQSGRNRRGGPKLSIGRNQRLEIPFPDRRNTDDLAAVSYIENRLGGELLSNEEIQRYKIVTCGLYGFLQTNGVESLTIDQREADRINETCVGFLSADESYLIFRSMDEEFVKRGGRRYTNYRIFSEWEGSKSFACRSNVNILEPQYTVVCSEGILDLIQIERLFYPEERWKEGHIGMATCGASHETVFRQLTGLGILSLNAELYIDHEPGMLERARRLPKASPFFQTPGFSLKIFRNTFSSSDASGKIIHQKDFGVSPNLIQRTQVRVQR